MYLVVFVLVLPISLFLIHINHWYYLKRVLDKHTAYIKGIPNSADDATQEGAIAAQAWILANQTEIKRRVNRAGLHGPRKAFMEPMGFGYVGQQTIDVLDNLLLHNTEVLQQARQTLEIAKGPLPCAGQAKSEPAILARSNRVPSKGNTQRRWN